MEQLIPFLFVLQPSLLLMGNTTGVALAVITAVCGCYFLGVGLSGFLFSPITPWARCMATLGGMGLLVPVGIGHHIGWISDIMGLLMVAPLFAWGLMKRKKRAVALMNA